jgi:hypothetical protein
MEADGHTGGFCRQIRTVEAGHFENLSQSLLRRLHAPRARATAVRFPATVHFS